MVFSSYEITGPITRKTPQQSFNHRCSGYRDEWFRIGISSLLVSDTLTRHRNNKMNFMMGCFHFLSSYILRRIFSVGILESDAISSDGISSKSGQYLYNICVASQSSPISGWVSHASSSK